jgi:transcriptional regulator with XRE-family HTH domain
MYPIGYNVPMAWNPKTLKRERERRGLTQEQLAQRAGTTRVTVARLEIGTRRPSVDLLPRLAKALNVNVNELLK